MTTANVAERAGVILEQRRSLGAYARAVMPDTYEQPPHVLLLIEYLEAVKRGEIRRLMVNMPPRSSKSMHCSRLLPAWWLGHHPSNGVILASYGDTLAVDNGRTVRDNLDHHAYPFGTRMRPDAKAAGRWYTQQGGGLIAVGRGAGLTGWMLPGNLLVPDDLIKDREEAESEVIRDSAWTWWQEVFSTRLARDGAIVFPSTRWHEDDVSGRILNSKGAADWEVLSFPYEAEADDPLGREPGELLTTYGYVPSVDKGEISAYGYSALYQQHPTPAGGAVFKDAWMQRRYCTCGDPQRCGNKPLPDRKSNRRWRVIHTADLGGKPGVGHDPSAIATWGWDGISKYIVDYWSATDEYTDVKAKAIAKTFEHRPRMTYIEDATWAQPLISDLRAAGIRVFPVPPEGSKWTRADAVSPEFQGGMVVLPEAAPWLDAWKHEHLAFPNAQHDEAVDTTSLALSVLKAQPATARTREIKERGIPDRRTAAERMLERVKAKRRG